MSRRRFPAWLVPSLSNTGIPFESARARLGAAAQAASMTEHQRQLRAKRMHKAWMEKTTPEQRKEWASAAGKKAAKKLAETFTIEERREFSRRAGIKSMQTRMATTTPEQRTEWARKAGKARAAQRAAMKGQAA